jgi:hypothetical protein
MIYIIIILIGIALVYFGINKKVDAKKKLGEMNVSEIGNAGCSGYLKMMMIIGGITLVIIGVILWFAFE